MASRLFAQAIQQLVVGLYLAAVRIAGQPGFLLGHIAQKAIGSLHTLNNFIWRDKPVTAHQATQVGPVILALWQSSQEDNPQSPIRDNR